MKNLAYTGNAMISIFLVSLDFFGSFFINEQIYLGCYGVKNNQNIFL